MEKQLLYIIMLSVLSCASSCGNGTITKTKTALYKSQIKEIADGLNSTYVPKAGDLGTMDSVEYVGDSVFTLYFTVNEQHYIIDAINRNKEAAKKYAMSAFVGQSQFIADVKNFFDLLVKSNSMYEVVYIGETTYKRARILLNTNEIKIALANNSTDTEEMRKLKSMVYGNNMQCPQRVDEITTLDSCGLSKNYFVFCYTLDDDDFDMRDLAANASLIKTDSYNILKTAYYLDLLSSCIACNKGIMFWYIGRKSHYKFHIIFSTEELRSIMDKEEPNSFQ